MAVVVRCSCVFPCSNSGSFAPRTWRSDQFSSKFYVSGKLASLPFKVKSFISSSGGASNGPYETHQALLGSQSMHLGPDGTKFSLLKENCDIDHMQPVDDTIVESFAAHEGMVLIRFPAIAFIVTNALMLTAPFQALAETCEADKSVFDMPLLLCVALIGATVGGLLARQRRGELQKLNEQLRQINAALRRQAKIESYAPTLSYAPVGGRILENEVIVDPRKQELVSHLKTGKNFLRNQDPEKAFVEFKTALELAQKLKDPIEEKKAARGLGTVPQHLRPAGHMSRRVFTSVNHLSKIKKISFKLDMSRTQ